MNTKNSSIAETPPYPSSKRVVLITGPTAGLGRGIALELARQRYQLVLLGRNPDKLKALSELCIAAGATEPMQLVCDMNSQKQVRQAAARFLDSGWPLHILINNAGLVNLTRRVTEDGLEESSAIACWSAFLLTMLLLPRLKDSAPSAIINTSSDTYPKGKIPFDDPSFKKNFNFLGCYEAAKLSNMYLTLRLAKMLKPYRIGVNIYNPGMIRTDIVSSNRKGLVRKLKIADLADKIYKLVSKPISDGIKAPVELATAAQLDAITGKFYHRNQETPVKPVALDAFTSNALWNFSQGLTGYPVPDFLSQTSPVTADPGKVRIGVLGAAKIAPYSLFKQVSKVPSLEVVALAEEHKSFGELVRYARKHIAPINPDVKLYRSFDRLLADPNIDAVYMPLPISIHEKWAIAAIKAGKHVLCEKPLAANAEQAAQINAAAKGSGLVVAEAMHSRYHPLRSRVRDIIQSGEIGQVTHLKITTSSLSYFYYIPNDFRFKYEMGGGTTLDFGCYPISFIRHVLGTEPEVVSAKAKISAPLIDGIMDAELQFPDGIRAKLFMAYRSWKIPLNISMHIYGTKGNIYILNFLKPEVYHRLVTHGINGRRSEHVPGDSTYKLQLIAFVDAIVKKQPILTDCADAAKTLKVIDSIYLKAGLPVRGKQI